MALPSAWVEVERDEADATRFWATVMDALRRSGAVAPDAMSTTAGIAAAIAMVGAVIALAFLPARARSEDPGLVPEPAMA